KGVVTTSLYTPVRCFFAVSETSLLNVLNISQSERDSHKGSIAGLNGCTKGCISVDDKSCFSYHVAAGNTISEYKGVEVILKSSETSKSNLPSVSSLH